MELGKLSKLLSNNDIVLAIGLVVIVCMMVIPLPPALLDLLLTVNISLAVVILLVCLYTQEPLDYSSFPTVLLIATLFRLGLNVSSTRLILLNGEAGNVINSFGEFVVGGNYVVGAVIFCILVLINFMVITGGATRVAEVSARFTLDKMPGKQLSIDADLNSGLINEDQAKERRKKLERETDFYGTMDGASKFVKGDATAGIVITVINIVGGLIIGVIQLHLNIQQALSTYTILTVGDGLVSQIPALLISTATGLIVSRATGKDESLSQDIKKEMFSDPRVLGVVSGLLGFMGIIPGMPTIPFLTIAAVAGGIHRQTAIRRGHHGTVTLQDQVHAPPGGVGPRTALTAPAQVAAGAEELPLMGRHHSDQPLTALHFIYTLLEGIYAVGVQHQRLFHIQQLPGQGVALVAAAQTAADQHRVTPCDALTDGLLRRQRHLSLLGRQRKGHGALAFHRRDGPDILRHPQIHKAAAAADGGGGRQHRRTGIAHRAAQAVHLAEGALVALRIALGQDAFHVGAGDLHGGTPFWEDLSHYTTIVKRNVVLSGKIFAIFLLPFPNVCDISSR